MAYDYVITLAGTAISTIVDSARFIKYTAGTKRGSNVVIPYKHGELFVPDKYFSSADVLLEVVLPIAAHQDAAEALSLIQLKLASQALVEVKQTDPYRGIIRANVELLAEAVPTQNEFVYLFALSNPSGFWESDSASSAASAAPPVVTTGGDRPVDDAILTAAAANTWLQHTDEIGQISRVTIDTGAGGTPPYIVDVGAGTVEDSAGSPVAKDEFLTVTQPWWMKFSPGAAQSFTSSGSWAVDWRNKWA